MKQKLSKNQYLYKRLGFGEMKNLTNWGNKRNSHIIRFIMVEFFPPCFQNQNNLDRIIKNEINWIIKGFNRIIKNEIEWFYFIFIF
jgi:hypothetical protein